MSARTPRRVFANPFVVTLAALPACYTSTGPAPTVAPIAPVEPTATATPPALNPPPATSPPTSPPGPVDYDQSWTVTKSGGTCRAQPEVECPKAEPGLPAPTCNPPPP